MHVYVIECMTGGFISRHMKQWLRIQENEKLIVRDSPEQRVKDEDDGNHSIYVIHALSIVNSFVDGSINNLP